MTGRAMAIGPSVGLVAHEILKGPVESIALASLERLFRLADRYSHEELERACSYGLSLEMTSRSSIAAVVEAKTCNDATQAPLEYLLSTKGGHFILDYTLMDVKCTNDPADVKRAALRQLIFYLDVKDRFVEIARAFSETHGYTYDDWIKVGVSATVLRKARIYKPRPKETK